MIQQWLSVSIVKVTTLIRGKMGIPHFLFQGECVNINLERVLKFIPAICTKESTRLRT